MSEADRLLALIVAICGPDIAVYQTVLEAKAAMLVKRLESR
jgi:hypothetical protein